MGEAIPVSEGAEQRDAGRAKSNVALTSVVAAVFLTSIKLLIGLSTGSLGILAEALHSALDLGAAALTYAAVRIASRPPDEDHPYGHGKVESFSALVETLLLVVTSVWIVYEGIERLFFRPVHLEPSVWAFVVMVTSMVVDYGRSRALLAAAKKYKSQALEADALHFSTDIWSSAVVLVGLLLVRFGGENPWFARADAIAALGVAIIVLWVSFRLGKSTVDVLLDAAPHGIAHQITEEVHKLPGVLACRRVRVRHVGPAVFVDLVVDVPRSAPLERAHKAASDVENCIHGFLPQADIVVHFEPTAQPGESWVEEIQAIAGEQGLYVHDVRMSDEGKHRTVNMHLEVDEDLSLAAAHELADGLEEALLAKVRGIDGVNTHIEPRSSRVLPGVAAPERRQDVLDCLDALCTGMPELHGFRDVTVHTDESRRLFVALRCFLDSNLSIGDAHRISTRIEDRVKKAIPDVQHVHVHVEPTER